MDHVVHQDHLVQGPQVEEVYQGLVQQELLEEWVTMVQLEVLVQLDLQDPQVLQVQVDLQDQQGQLANVVCQEILELVAHLAVQVL